MEARDAYLLKLRGLQGKTIALVYAFEKENAKGSEHYDTWKSRVIADWMVATEELKCVPFIIDVRTFVNKAMNNSLPFLDFVVNLNAGANNLSSLGLIPSICGFIDVPCIPCDTASTILGEHKRIANLIALSERINVPKSLADDCSSGITRPICYGSSRGVKKGFNPILGVECIYQEFISGYDLTTPILFNPISRLMDVLPAVLYVPHETNGAWYLGEAEKEAHVGYEKRVTRVDLMTSERYVCLAKSLGIKTYCRIDARIMKYSEEEMDDATKTPINFNRINFLEINPLPTITENINFHTSLSGLEQGDAMYSALEAYKQEISDWTYTGFILSSSILAHQQP